MTMRPIRKKATPHTGYAMMLTTGSAKKVAQWCRGTVELVYPSDQSTVKILAVKYKTGGDEKQVLLGEYLVHFRGEFFAVKYDEFPNRFEFTTGKRDS